MWISVLVVVAVVTAGRGQLTIYSRQFAKGLNITCAYQNDTGSNISVPVSIVISKSVDDQNQVLASISTFKSTVSHVPDAKVTGSVNSSSNVGSNLTIHWTNSSFHLKGNYSCTLYGLDSNNEERAITQKLTVLLEDTDPEIRATPSHIVDGFTPTLVVDCSISNLAVYDFSEVLQVEISHSYNDSSHLIARLNSTHQPAVSSDNTTSLANGWEVISSYFKSKSAYLAVKLPHPTTKDAGKYTCDVSTTSNSTAHIVKSINVTASVSSPQFIYDILTDQDSLQDYFLFACNFEHGVCGLNLTAPSNITGWTLMPDRLLGQGLHYGGPWQDVFGHYLYLDAASLHTDLPFIIETKMIPPIRRPVCLSFWLFETSSLRSLNMYVRQGGLLVQFYNHAGFFGGPWQHVETQLPLLSQPVTVVMEFKGTFRITGFIAIDDLIISDFNCD
ncbi:hypothetical protein BsWGS_07286 [Bradybaena similaris]